MMLYIFFAHVCSIIIALQYELNVNKSLTAIELQIISALLMLQKKA